VCLCWFGGMRGSGLVLVFVLSLGVLRGFCVLVFVLGFFYFGVVYFFYLFFWGGVLL